VPTRAAKRNKAGLATKEQLYALGKRYAQELWEQGVTFDELDALYNQQRYKKTITQSTLEAIKGFDRKEDTVRIPPDATWESCLDGQGWKVMGHTEVITSLVTYEQTAGPTTVVRVRVPISYLLPGDILDSKRALQVYEEMGIKPDLFAQILINTQGKVTEPNITLWKLKNAIFGIKFEPRSGEKQDQKLIIASHVGHKVSARAWLVGIPK
jgi:hypothetical protein